MIRHQVEDHVVTLPAPREVRAGVIHHPVGADGTDHLHVPGAADAGHVRAERLGDLHRERSDASGRAVDQNPLSRLDPSCAQTLQCGEPRKRNRGRLLERNVRGLRGQVRFGGTRILGERPPA